MDPNSDICLIDVSYNVFYRFFALRQWYKRAHPDKNIPDNHDWLADEGFMTKLRTRLVCGHQLSIFAELLGLNKLYLISNHVEDRCDGRNNRRIMEDAFESFIGAMYLYFNKFSEENYSFEIQELDLLKILF